MEKICAICRSWIIDQNVKVKLPKDIQEQLDALRKTYGKCTATYLDSNGNVQRYDSGAVGGMTCGSYDDNGNELFEEDDALVSITRIINCE